MSDPLSPAQQKVVSGDTQSEEQQQPGLLDLTGKFYFPIAFIGRLPFAMVVVGVLLLITAARGSYAEAGLSSAMVGLGAAIFGPLLGALADRIGQRPVLISLALSHSLTLICIVWLSYQTVPFAVILINAVLVGATSPQLSPMSRARLVNIINHGLSGTKRQKTFSHVMSFESVADELVFVFGPVLVGVFALWLGDWSPLTIAAGVTLFAITCFALHPSSRKLTPKISDTGAAPQQAPARELFTFDIIILVLAMVATGWVFGSTLTSLTAYMGDLGEESSAGIMYGILGVGSAVLAMAMAFLSQRFSLNARLLVFGSLVFLGGLLFPFASSIELMVLVLLLTGFGIGPVLVTNYSLASIRGPHGRSNTIMTMLSSAIVVGQSSAAAIVGFLAENLGTFSALFAVSVAGFLLFLFAAINFGHQRRSQR